MVYGGVLRSRLSIIRAVAGWERLISTAVIKKKIAYNISKNSILGCKKWNTMVYSAGLWNGNSRKP